MFGVIPICLDIFMPLNESRPRYLPAQLEYYFFDRNEYYTFTYMHFGIIGSYAVMLIVINDVGLFTFSRHACAMFCVLRYRLKNINNNEDGERIDDSNVHKIYKNIRSCAILHDRILIFLENTNSCFAMCLLFLICVTIIIMSFNGSMIILNMHDNTYLLRGVSVSMGQIIHVFFNCFTGQMVQSHSANMPNYIYDHEWYNSNHKIKMVIYFMILKSKTECSLCVGKTAVLGLELFTTVSISL
ncbi:odorant receptor 22c-like [Leptopilina boulardi]|uniref:odorant receptor 22c-like n=1 Tax=Leptopilina boulardi TaxID=63433 RepID=UPI0021F63A16|nr:odorant receptor 22c-like [Leptopilina boulardi]